MNPATIELTAPDISCDKCKANIEGDLAGEPGHRAGHRGRRHQARPHRLRPAADQPRTAAGQAQRDRLPGRSLSLRPILNCRIGHVMNNRAPFTARRAGLARRLALDHNPLRRHADRLETWIMAGLLAAFLAGAPLVAVAAGSWAHAGDLRQQRAQRSWYQVSAVLLQTAPPQSAFRHTSPPAVSVRARWTSPGGRARLGMVPVPPGSRAGSRLLVWADRSGPVAGTPLTGDVIRRPGDRRRDAGGGRTDAPAARPGRGGPIAAGSPAARRLGSRLDLDRATMDPAPALILRRHLACHILSRAAHQQAS